MRTLTGNAVAAINTGHIAIAQLVHMAFTPTPVSLNTSNWPLVWDGVTYLGAYGLGAVSPIADQPGQAGGLTFELSGADAGNIGLAMDAADIIQGTPCSIRTAIVRTSDYTVVDAPLDWAGYLDTMTLAEDGLQAAIRVAAESKAIRLIRSSPRYYSDTDQRGRVNANDGSFRHVLNQAGVPFAWPARSFFLQ